MAIARITVSASNPSVSGAAVNVVHMQTAGTTLANFQTVVDQLRDFYTGCASLYHTSTTITVGSRVIDLTPPLPTYVGTTPRTVVGTGSGTQLPAQLAACVSWRTAVATRSGRGRTYLGPIATSALTSYVLTPTILTAVQTAANALVATGNLVVRSAKLDSTQLVTSAIFNNIVDTMRTRGQNG